MLSWTEAGAVQRPETVQIRVQRSYPGRVRAGAPVPTRSMSEQELRANLRHFTIDQRGPRTAPCTALVLSGVGVLSRQDTPRVLELGRQLGLSRVILHAGNEDLGELDVSSLEGLADQLVVPLQARAGSGGLEAGSQAVRACQRVGIRVSANTVLDQAAADDLQAVARTVAELRPDDVTFTFPFPQGGSGPPPPPAKPTTREAQQRAQGIMATAGVAPRVKGLPACYLGQEADALSPSSNRWYVDADHQLGKALLFFPQVVAFHKGEVCRFCSRDGCCDGFFSAWLELPGFPALEPFDAPDVS